jgi:lysophospholipase L1-like esterase
MSKSNNLVPKRILAYGDSLTWGWIPLEIATPSRRYPPSDRWPGVMQRVLGNGYEIIEAGLNCRTADIPDPTQPQVPASSLDGSADLPATLATHLPLDLAMIMLGTNDLKTMFGRSALRIALGCAKLIDIVQTIDGGVLTNYPNPRVLLIAPPALGKQTCFAEFFIGGVVKSEQFARLYAGIAELANVEFFDAGTVIHTAGADGVHLTATAHRRLGLALAERVRSILA